MIKRFIIVLALAAIAVGLYPLAWGVEDAEVLTRTANEYVKNGADDLGAANLVTSVVVSYRGLDTLGEITVLFAATAGVTMLFAVRKPKRKGASGDNSRRTGSELLQTGAAILFPILWMFGIYIFVHGHLTPGGGFQGGVVIASAVLLLLFADSDRKMGHTVLQIAEALSGAAYVAVGLLGLWFAAGFLDPRFLPAGEFGQLFSAGAIPVIYSLIGIKVGAELTGIVDSMRRSAT
jgi:multicomponent Na+:H+ antiporter subunit B